MKNISNVMCKMIEYFGSDAKRINHFIKVFGFAKAIAEGENVSSDILEIIEVTALVHDIGIKLSEENITAIVENIKKSKGLLRLKNCLLMLVIVKALLKEFAILSGIIIHTQT